MIVVLLLALLAVEPEDEQRKAKLAAEAMYTLTSAATGSDKLVKDKPYSAEGTTETILAGAGGTRNVRHNSTKYYRDRSGRTRREQLIESLGPGKPLAPIRLIFISDPVENIDVVLDPVQKVARKFARLEIDDGGRQRPAQAVEKLGRQRIEGLECIGTRTAVTESWYAPAIEAIVRSNTKDARYGESNYNLHHIALGDQPRSLFEIPPDYRIEAGGPTELMKLRRDE